MRNPAKAEDNARCGPQSWDLPLGKRTKREQLGEFSSDMPTGCLSEVPARRPMAHRCGWNDVHIGATYGGPYVDSAPARDPRARRQRPDEPGDRRAAGPHARPGRHAHRAPHAAVRSDAARRAGGATERPVRHAAGNRMATDPEPARSPRAGTLCDEEMPAKTVRRPAQPWTAMGAVRGTRRRFRGSAPADPYVETVPVSSVPFVPHRSPHPPVGTLAEACPRPDARGGATGAVDGASEAPARRPGAMQGVRVSILGRESPSRLIRSPCHYGAPVARALLGLLLSEPRAEQARSSSAPDVDPRGAAFLSTAAPCCALVASTATTGPDGMAPADSEAAPWLMHTRGEAPGLAESQR